MKKAIKVKKMRRSLLYYVELVDKWLSRLSSTSARAHVEDIAEFVILVAINTDTTTAK